MPKSFLCRSQYFSRFGAPKTHCWGKRRPLLGLLLIRRPIHLGLNSFLTVATLFSRIPSSTSQPPRSTRSSSTLEPCAAAANLWAPPPTFVERRAAAAADNLLARPRYQLLLRSYLWEFSMTSSLSSMPSGRFRPPMIPCFSMLSFFFKFAVFLAHHPVQ